MKINNMQYGHDKRSSVFLYISYEASKKGNLKMQSHL